MMAVTGSVRTGTKRLLLRSKDFLVPRTILASSKRRSFSSTAYSGKVGDGTLGMDHTTLLASYIPFPATIKNGRTVEVAPFRESDWEPGMQLMNLIIREGKSWPFEEEFATVDDFRAYYLSHTAFVVRSLEDGVDSNGQPSPSQDFLGSFYIKPNFPGRCSHICNGGFITSPNHRQQGVARLMGHVFLQAAKDLGYSSAYFNLVFKSNGASVVLWESLGFERVAILEQAARLSGVDGLDTAYGYRFDLTKLPADYLFQNTANTSARQQRCSIEIPRGSSLEEVSLVPPL
jgi:RimJ/RimL family protein N-acetyltransferase